MYYKQCLFFHALKILSGLSNTIDDLFSYDSKIRDRFHCQILKLFILSNGVLVGLVRVLLCMVEYTELVTIEIKS